MENSMHAITGEGDNNTTPAADSSEAESMEEQLQRALVAEEGPKKMRILVAIDESDDSLYVVNWVLEHLFRQPPPSSTDEQPPEQQDHLTVLHVMPRLPQYVFPGAPVVIPAVSIVESATRCQKEHAAAVVSRAEQICKDRKVEAESVTLEGEPKETICQATEQMHVDLLVVGSRGLGKIKRAFLGSVSDYCAHHAKCPVVIVKPPKESHK